MPEMLRAIRGMNDILPDDARYWQYVERVIASIAARYAYREIRTPVVEQTRLFKRSIGEDTDVVAKEMYSFGGQEGDSLSLRPEGTASCVRALLQHGLIRAGQAQKVFYQGPMFRHERPQKGRYRQFQQIGVEAFNLRGPDVDVEMLMLARDIWSALGVDSVKLEINSLGNAESRREYRRALTDYLRAHEDQLDDDSRVRLERNPLRILDSKNPQIRELIAQAPKLLDHLDADSRSYFERYRELLDAAGVEYTVNPCLVRGLDYYTDVVFEWITGALGAQNAVCSGGRYDGLVETLGGKATPAVGFALGVERLLALIDKTRVPLCAPDIYVLAVGAAAETAALQLTSRIREAHSHYSVQMNLGGGSFKTQLRRANRSGAAIALILGDTEVDSNTVGIKPLRTKEEQQSVAQAEIDRALAQYLKLSDNAPPETQASPAP